MSQLNYSSSKNIIKQLNPNVYRNKQYRQETIQELTKTILSTPQSDKAYYLRSFCYYLDYEYDEALKDINKAIELSPNDAEYHYHKATLYASRDMRVRGWLLFNNPKEYADKYGNELDLSQDNKMANESFSKAISLNPNDPRYYYERALSYGTLSLKDKDISKKQKADYKKAFELNPYDWSIRKSYQESIGPAMRLYSKACYYLHTIMQVRL